MIVTLKKNIIGWKKAKTFGGSEIIVKLLIPKGAQVHAPDIIENDRRLKFATETYRRKVGEDCLGKCRASQAKVLGMTYRSHAGKVDEARSLYSGSFFYRTGETVRPYDRFSTANIACAAGIHFFLHRHQAVIW